MKTLKGNLSETFNLALSVEGLTPKRIEINRPLKTDQATLLISWTRLKDHGIEPDRRISTVLNSPPGVDVSSWTAAPDTIQGIAVPPEQDIIEAAWHLGAAVLMRTERKPYPAEIDPLQMQYGLVHKFRGISIQIMGRQISFGNADDDYTELIHLAAKNGLVSYAFTPGRTLFLNAWAYVPDSTLDEYGLRHTPCPTWATPVPLGLPNPDADAHEFDWEFIPKPFRRRVRYADINKEPK